MLIAYRNQTQLDARISEAYSISGGKTLATANRLLIEPCAIPTMINDHALVGFP